jgi:DHA3 family tetracycline resistance protein-like MFS transporter
MATSMRAATIDGMRMLRPLRERDFALLWTGTTISLIGDGIYFVAIAFQVYELSNSPTALALVGLSWSLGMVGFLLTGGIASDRFDRRRVIVAADLARLVVLAVIGVLSLAGALEIWHLIALVVIYGAGEAFFGPAFGALVPDIVPAPLLVQANALDQFVRPFALRLVGPAVGGALVAGAGAGTAFLVDAATFGASAACIALVRPRARAVPARRSIRAELRDGFAFVRANTWLWATLIAASIALLVFWGPVEVLVPYVIKNDLGGDAGDFGLFLAANGAGAVLASAWMGRADLPGRPVTFMYLAWGLGTFPIAGYALASATWQLMALSFVFGAAMSMGMVIWFTLMQTRVPPELRGRVTSMDYFVSIGLVPVSFALTAPLAAGIGVEATLIGAGLIGGVSTLALLIAVPGLRERGEVLGEARIRDSRGLHPDDVDALPGGESGDGAEHREAVVAPRLDRPAG